MAQDPGRRSELDRPGAAFDPGTKLFSVVSYVFHVGVLIVPVLLAEHIALWEALLGVNLPSISNRSAELLTLCTILCGTVLLGIRTFSRAARANSRRSDYLLLLAVLLPFVSGYLAMHPQYNPFPWQIMMLIHLLSADLLFLLVPFTKLSHVVLFFFDRISALHWQLRPGAGDKIAEALFGEEARV